MCDNTGVYMLNGRTNADSLGACTYMQLGGKGKSVIDYALVSRDLLNLEVKHMIDFWVVPVHICPARLLGGRYDHCPIVTRVGWTGIKEGAGGVHDPAGHDLHMRWKPELRSLYTDIVQTDGIVLSHLVRVKDNDSFVQESCTALISAVTRAAEALHNIAGGIFVRRKRNDMKKVKWLSSETMAIRRRLKIAEHNLPNSRNIVQELRRLYRRHVNADRRVFLTQKRDKIRRDMVSNVKNFWARFKKGRKVASVHSVGQWSNYFDKLFNEGKKEWHPGELEDHCSKFEDLFGSPSELEIEGAVCLNNEIQEHEVHAALKAVNLGKAAGADKIPAEFFRQAYHEARYVGEDGKPRIVREYLLTPYLTKLFHKILARQQYPLEWAVGVVTPVPKPKGDNTSMDNYRAITVGSAISKIFAQVLMTRIDKWAEYNGRRAPTQFGFRSGMGTMEAVFMLRHLVDKSQTLDKSLYTAFIDFKKAYDSVPRELLWRVLNKTGIHGAMLDVLQQMYQHVRLQVKVDNVYGHSFDSSIGVKQGDPLSPLLFGLYIDRFAFFYEIDFPVGMFAVVMKLYRFYCMQMT
jgi:hypothetical protein